MSEFIKGISILCAYFIVCATTALILRKSINIPNELFRKILHFILLLSLPVFVYSYDTWWMSSLTCILIIVIAYPVLFFFERFKSYSETVTERKKGELKSSLIIVFIMFATVISVCWRVLNNKTLSLAVIYSWGIGDAFAALIGTKYGRHKIYRKKSLEGTLAMFISSFASVMIILSICNIIPWYAVLISSLTVSLVSTTAELFTPNGFDTITCPFASLIAIIPLLYLFGGITL